jgi:membrane protease YdiL (CAAX protease family)
MRGPLISTGKILGFLGIWSVLLVVVVMSAVVIGGQHWFSDTGWRFFVEIGGAAGVLIALLVMALGADRRALASLGFNLDWRLLDLVSGTALGALILAAPIGVLVAMGAARWAPDLSLFSSEALVLGLALCFFNVVTQEALVRSYIFQELWAKYGALIAVALTTILFVALHAGPISQGAQGLVAGVNILLASVLLGLAYVRSGALWLPIGIHFGWNGLQGPVFGINVTGAELSLGHWSVFEFFGDPLLTGGVMGVEGGLVGLIGPAIGIVVVALLVKQRAKPDFSARAK